MFVSKLHSSRWRYWTIYSNKKSNIELFQCFFLLRHHAFIMDSREMTGNEKERDVTMIHGWTWTGHVAGHGLNPNFQTLRDPLLEGIWVVGVFVLRLQLSKAISFCILPFQWDALSEPSTKDCLSVCLSVLISPINYLHILCWEDLQFRSEVGLEVTYWELFKQPAPHMPIYFDHTGCW